MEVATAYPGTPSTEILERLAGYPEVYAEWSVNEKVAVEVALGATAVGARALAAMKLVGVNVASDPLFSASYSGVRGGFVLVSADDPGRHSSQNEQDNRHYARFLKLPLLEPADSQEAKDFVGEAFALSEEFHVPVILTDHHPHLALQRDCDAGGEGGGRHASRGDQGRHVQPHPRAFGGVPSSAGGAVVGIGRPL